MDSSTIGAIASVLTLAISIVLLFTQVQLPYVHAVHLSPERPKKGTSFSINFSVSAPLSGTRLTSIEIPGYKLRDMGLFVKEPGLAETIVKPNFTSSPDIHDVRFGFDAYALSRETSEVQVLIVRWRWHFFSWRVRYSLA